MLVRDEIRVSRPANGGLDVPLVWELGHEEQLEIDRYLVMNLSGDDHGRVHPRDFPLRDAAYRLAERGIPQEITHLVRHELLARGRLKDAESLEPFVVVGAK